MSVKHSLSRRDTTEKRGIIKSSQTHGRAIGASVDNPDLETLPGAPLLGGPAGAVRCRVSRVDDLVAESADRAGIASYHCRVDRGRVRAARAHLVIVGYEPVRRTIRGATALLGT